VSYSLYVSDCLTPFWTFTTPWQVSTSFFISFSLLEYFSSYCSLRSSASLVCDRLFIVCSQGTVSVTVWLSARGGEESRPDLVQNGCSFSFLILPGYSAHENKIDIVNEADFQMFLQKVTWICSPLQLGEHRRRRGYNMEPEVSLPCRIWGFHGGEYGDGCLLGCSAV
jgi:hypothetical protein